MTRRSSLGLFSSLPASISWSITYFVNYTRPEPAHHCSLGSISMSSTFIVVVQVVYPFILFCCHLLLSHGILIFISNWWYPHTPSHGYGFGRGTNIGIRTRTPPYPSQIPAQVCVPLAFTNHNPVAHVKAYFLQVHQLHPNFQQSVAFLESHSDFYPK